MLKAITDQIAGTLRSDTVKNPKLSTSLDLSARSYPNMDPQCSNHIHGLINAVTIHSEQQSDSYDKKANENEEEEKDSPKNIHVNPSTPPNPLVSFITKKVLKFNSFFESPRKNDDSSEEEPKEERSIIIEEVGAEYFDTFPTRRVVRFTNRTNNVAYKMPYKNEEYNSLSDLEKEHTKLVYLRNKEDKRKGVDYVTSKILGFYKECLELEPEYLTGMDDEGEVTLYLTRRSWKDLRMFSLDDSWRTI
nr:retrotransposon Orf1 [Tanacetum cinerariifolium]